MICDYLSNLMRDERSAERVLYGRLSQTEGNEQMIHSIMAWLYRRMLGARQERSAKDRVACNVNAQTICMAEIVISAFGISVLSLLFLQWWLTDDHTNIAGHLAAFTSVVLFAVIGLRFIHQWFAFWTRKDAHTISSSYDPSSQLWLVFFRALFFGSFSLFLILFLRALKGDSGTLIDRLAFFNSIDTGCYMDIASYWYAPSPLADPRRIVFFPLYPLFTRIISKGIGNVLIAGTIVSVFFNALSCTVLYRLLLLDYPQAQTGKATWMMFTVPAAFFLSVPMSESVFFFFSLISYYYARKERWFAAGLFGAFSAFSRSLGILILAPLVFEAISVWVKRAYHARKGFLSIACCMLVLLGSVAFLCINEKYYGNPLYFMDIEDQYWNQRMGIFFSSTAFQIDNALADIQMPYYTNALGLWFPNVICCMSALLLMAWAGGRIRPSYSLWFIVYYYVAISPTYLISAPRYLVVSVPLYPAFAELWANPRRGRAVALLLAICAAAYIYAFASSWEVY